MSNKAFEYFGLPVSKISGKAARIPYNRYTPGFDTGKIPKELLMEGLASFLLKENFQTYLNTGSLDLDACFAQSTNPQIQKFREKIYAETKTPYGGLKLYLIYVMINQNRKFMQEGFWKKNKLGNPQVNIQYLAYKNKTIRHPDCLKYLETFEALNKSAPSPDQEVDIDKEADKWVVEHEFPSITVYTTVDMDIIDKISNQLKLLGDDTESTTLPLDKLYGLLGEDITSFKNEKSENKELSYSMSAHEFYLFRVPK